MDENGDTEIDPFQKKSSWVPPLNRVMALETYITAVGRDITKTLPRNPSHYDNLTKEERRALRFFMTRTDIVIRKADKGSATVIMSREDYINKVRRHLDNRDHYLKPNDDLTQRFSLEIKEALIGMVNRFSIPERTNSYTFTRRKQGF